MESVETVGGRDVGSRPPAGIELRLASCLTVQIPRVPCSACRDTCPAEAIQISDRLVRIDPAGCTGCGRCATACPTGAIRAEGFSIAHAYECNRVREAGRDGIGVPCLGGVTAEHFRDAMTDGNVTIVDRGWCAACPASGGDAAPWKKAVDAVNEEAEVLGLDERVHVRLAPLPWWRARPAPQPGTQNPRRRAFFVSMAKADNSTEPTDPLARLPSQVKAPGLRRRAAQLAQLAGHAPLPAALFPRLQCTNDLTDLRVPARFCPTGALTILIRESAENLVFDATACTACGACAASGEIAVQPTGTGTFFGPVVLATRHLATCSRCRMRFAPKGAQTVCDGCDRDTDLAALAHGLMRRRTN